MSNTQASCSRTLKAQTPPSVASVHRVATIPQAPGELLLHRDGFVARGHRVEASIQPWSKVLPMLSHIPRGSVAILVLTKALRRRHHALANVDGGIPGVAAGTHRVVQLDYVDVVAAQGCSWLGCAWSSSRVIHHLGARVRLAGPLVEPVEPIGHDPHGQGRCCRPERGDHLLRRTNPSAFGFGHHGKPSFVQSPRDNPTAIRKTLERSTGGATLPSRPARSRGGHLVQPRQERSDTPPGS
jgi:hypothetical protein